MTREEAVLGVLGGLGPGATVSFMQEIVDRTPAEKDQDHLEMIVYNDPKVPDRNYPEQRSGSGPLPRLLRNAGRLEEAGADFIVIASNTTHRYHDDIASSVEVPVPHMLSLVEERVSASDIETAGVLTTTTAMELGLFEEAFAGSGIDLVYPEDMEQVMDSIYTYKRGDHQEAQRLMDSTVKQLSDRDVGCIILGCTEFSALPWEWELDGIDPASVLATHCIEFAKDITLE